MARYFHVSSSLNRGSIREHGLDSARMGVSRGIAGSYRPEVEGVFLGQDYDVEYFTDMNNTGGPVDVWAVDDIDEDDFRESSNGYLYVPGVIPADRLTLVATDIRPSRAVAAPIPHMRGSRGQDQSTPGSSCGSGSRGRRT